VISRDMRIALNPQRGSGLFRLGAASWLAGGLVVAGGVENEFAQQFPGGGVEDADVKVLDEDQDAGVG